MDGLVSAGAGLLTGGQTLEGLLFGLLVAWLCGQAIGWLYARSSGVLSYSQTFVQSLALLTMVVALITGVIGDSMARAFGMAGAMAVVRFRTPVKDARDAVFLFFAVAVGMAAGTGNAGFAAAATAVIGAAGLWQDWTAFGSRSLAEGMLRFKYAGTPEARAQVDAILQRHCRVYQLSAARVATPGGPEELVYDINLRSPAGADPLVRDLNATGTVSAISLLPLARAGES